MPQRGDNEIAEFVGRELEIHMAVRNMTQTELAKRVGVTPVAIHLRLTGKVGIDTADLWEMCEAIGVKPAMVTEYAYTNWLNHVMTRSQHELVKVA